MDHPSISRIFDAGTTNSGRPYFVMELVKGIPITDYCEQNDLTIPERLDLFETVCQAVHHAHQKSVIHRDLKPSNILVTVQDEKPIVKVIDFGIAKALNQRLTERTLFTRLSQVIGTPLYMSPEQAEMSGLDVDTRSDIYSLGVLLYELLTGSTPFDGERLHKAALQEIRRIIRDEEPSKPSTKIRTLGNSAVVVAEHRKTDPNRLSVLLRGDLDWIVMRALEKDRTRRYETARDFAVDIRRHIEHKVVEAGPPSVAYRFSKFVKRHRAGVAIATATLISLLIALMGLSGGLIYAVAAWRVADEKTTEAVRAGEAEKTQRERAEHSQYVAEHGQYVAEIRWAQSALKGLHAGTVEDTLLHWIQEPGMTKPGTQDVRGWELDYLLGELKKQLVWTLGDHVHAITAVAWAPDNRRFASVADENVVRIWDRITGQQIAELPVADSHAYHLCWSADGNMIATGHADGTIRLWDGVTYEARGSLEGHKRSPIAWIPSMAFSRDRKRLVSYGLGHSIRIWDLDTLSLVRSIPFGTASDDDSPVSYYFPRQLSLSPDGSRVAATSVGSCKIWSVSTGEELLDLTQFVEHGACVAWSPDGSQIALGTGPVAHYYCVAIINTISGSIQRKLVGHKEPVTAAKWSVSGDRLMTASRDYTINIWSVRDGRILRTLQGHKDVINSADWSSDGRLVVSGSEDGTARVWDVEADTQQGQPMQGHTSAIPSVAWSPDGTRLATGSWDKTIRIWDPVTRQLIKKIGSPAGSIQCIAWSPDGKRIALGGAEPAQVVDADSGESLISLDDGQHIGAWAIAWSPDGSKIATALKADGGLEVWDAVTGKSLRSYTGKGNRWIGDVEWSPDGKWLAWISIEQLQIRDFSTDREIIPASVGVEMGGDEMAFSRSGREIAWSSGNLVVVYDIESGKPVCTLRGHSSRVTGISWNSDGSRLATSTQMERFACGTPKKGASCCDLRSTPT